MLDVYVKAVVDDLFVFLLKEQRGNGFSDVLKEGLELISLGENLPADSTGWKETDYLLVNGPQGKEVSNQLKENTEKVLAFLEKHKTRHN